MAPLQWIRDIRGAEHMEEELPVLNWSDLFDRAVPEEKDKYLIIFTYNDIVFGAAVTQVTGLCEIGQESMLELKKPVRSRRNLFLKAAVVQEDAVSRTAFESDRGGCMDGLAFILDPAVLSEFIYQDAG